MIFNSDKLSVITTDYNI